MASISANGSKGHHKFTLTVTETGTSVANNTSTISFSFKLSPITNGYDWANWTNASRTVSYSVRVNGTAYTGTIPNYDGSSTVTLKSGTQTVTHNSDGTKTISFSFSVTDTIPKDYSPGNASANGTLALTAFEIEKPSSGAAPIIYAYVEDTNSSTIALTGDSSTLIRYHSDALATMDVYPQHGASIDAYSIRNGSVTSSVDSCTFYSVGSNVFTFSAKDNRGYVGTETVTPNMVDYVRLTCNMANSRPDASGNMYLSCSGNYFNGSFGAVHNELTLRYRCTDQNGYLIDSGEMYDISFSGNKYTASVYLSGLDYQTTYSFQITAQDKLESTVSVESGVKSKPVFHWGENDFAFEVPVNFNNGLNVGNLSINAQTLTSGYWAPYLDWNAVSSYTTQEGWYLKIGTCVVIGFNINAQCYSGYDNKVIKITGLPYTPSRDAFGGGVAYRVFVGDNMCFEGWGVNTSGEITARIQPCNTSADNLNISTAVYYPKGGGQVTLSGTICYITNY